MSGIQCLNTFMWENDGVYAITNNNIILTQFRENFLQNQRRKKRKENNRKTDISISSDNNKKKVSFSFHAFLKQTKTWQIHFYKNEKDLKRENTWTQNTYSFCDIKQRKKNILIEVNLNQSNIFWFFFFSFLAKYNYLSINFVNLIILKNGTLH